MEQSLNIFVDKLVTRTRLNAAERQAILSLVGKTERLEAHKSFVLLGDAVSCATLVVEGLCARVDQPTEDRRQITAIYVKGDMPDLYSLFQPESLATLEALTPATIARIPHNALREVVRAWPAVGEALARYVVADAAITAEWLVNVGSREARAALAHLFCEMAVRLGEVEGNRVCFHFPLSQLQLSEATGFSAVHVNRCLGSLRRDGLMSIARGVVTVQDWRALSKAAHFDDRYLVPPAPRRFVN